MFTDNKIYEMIEVDKKEFMERAESGEFGLWAAEILDIDDNISHDDGIHRVVLHHPDPSKLFITFANNIGNEFGKRYDKWSLFNTQSRVWNIELNSELVIMAQLISD